VTKGEFKIPYDQDATLKPDFQLTTTTYKISLTKIEVSDAGRGSAGILAT
jgi:hypothetical protein